ncbi:MAG: FecR domain-containing protein [Terriglobia bacterium]
MLIESRFWTVFAVVLGGLVPFTSVARPIGEQPLGRILYSTATTLRGVAAPKSATILSGDVLSTFSSGNAVIELMSGAKLRITEYSSVRFLANAEKVQVDLLAGAVVSESVGKPVLVVTTSNYHFTPSQEGDCRFAVALSKQRDAVVGAMQGSLLIMTTDSLGSYILPEGEYAAIPAASVGVPAQEKAVGETASAEAAGIVRSVTPEVLHRRGQAVESPLKLNDCVSLQDVVRTLRSGRVRIELMDGSFLNVGALSVMRIMNEDTPAHQTQVELTLGRMRAEVAEATKSDSILEVRTMTATIGVAGAELLVHALPNLTEVNCVVGECSVRNIDPAIPGQVALHGGESTTVPGGLPPTDLVQTLPGRLQSQIKETDVGPASVAAVGPVGQRSTSTGPWRVGSLSEGTSILPLLGMGGGGAAAAAIAAFSGHGEGDGATSPGAP